MITIPTSELTGTIADVLGFVDDDKNNAYRGIVIAWTGDELKVSGYDVLSGGTATWVPGEGVESTVADEDSVGNPIGDWGAWDDSDQAWRVWVGLDDAKEIVKTFKLPAKEALTPVTIETNISQSRLIVARAKTDKRSAHTMTIDTDTAQVTRVPNPEEIVDGATEAGAQMQLGLALAAHRLAAFGAVRQWDVAAFTFGREGEPIAVQISSRFSGFIFAAGDTQNAYAIAKGSATSPVTVEAELEQLYGDDPESADLLSDPNA